MSSGSEKASKQLTEKPRNGRSAPRAILLTRAKGQLLAARRKATAHSTIDQTFVRRLELDCCPPPYLEAARVLETARLPRIRSKDVERVLGEAWTTPGAFCIESAGRAWRARSTIRFFAVAALLDAYEVTLDRRYFDIAERAMRLAVERIRRSRWRPDFFDRAKDRAPMGGLDVRPQAAAGFTHAGGELRRPQSCSIGSMALQESASTANGLKKLWKRSWGWSRSTDFFAATYGLAGPCFTRVIRCRWC